MEMGSGLGVELTRSFDFLRMRRETNNCNGKGWVGWAVYVPTHVAVELRHGWGTLALLGEREAGSLRE